MLQKHSTIELIVSSIQTLLLEKSIEKITVREIASNCGITAPTFYNHFKDKNEVVSCIYIRYMHPYIESSLDEWNERRSELFMSNPSFFQHTICYEGQNSLLDTITRLDFEKYKMHMKPEIKESSSKMKMILHGIHFMIYGNCWPAEGILRREYLHYHGRIFRRVSKCMGIDAAVGPQVVQDNLCPFPVRKPSPELMQLID